MFRLWFESLIYETGVMDCNIETLQIAAQAKKVENAFTKWLY